MIVRFFLLSSSCRIDDNETPKQQRKRQRGRVLRAPDLKSGGRAIKSRSDYLASQLVASRHLGFLNLLWLFDIFFPFSLRGMPEN